MIRNDCEHHCHIGICLGTYVDGCDLNDRNGTHLADCTGCESFEDRGWYLEHGHPSVRRKDSAGAVGP